MASRSRIVDPVGQAIAIVHLQIVYPDIHSALGHETQLRCGVKTIREFLGQMITGATEGYPAGLAIRQD